MKGTYGYWTDWISFVKARKTVVDEDLILDYSKFRYKTIRTIFNYLHGIDFEDVELSVGIEILAWTNFEGQIDEESDTETKIFNELAKQLKAFKVLVFKKDFLQSF